MSAPHTKGWNILLNTGWGLDQYSDEKQHGGRKGGNVEVNGGYFAGKNAEGGALSQKRIRLNCDITYIVINNKF